MPGLHSPHPRELETPIRPSWSKWFFALPNSLFLAGVICHVTRCGSTLASNALAMVENVRTLSEVPWLDKLMNVVAERPHYSVHAGRRSASTSYEGTRILSWYNSACVSHQMRHSRCRRAKGYQILVGKHSWVMITRNPVEVVHSNLERPPKAILTVPTLSRVLLVYRRLMQPTPEFLVSGLGGFARICAEATAQPDPTCAQVLDYSEISPGRLPLRSHGTLVFRSSMRVMCKFLKALNTMPSGLMNYLFDDTCHKQTTASDVVRRAVDKWALTEYQRLLDSGHRLRIAIRTPITQRV